MKRLKLARFWAALLSALMCARAHAGDTVDDDTHHSHFFARLKPRGGWNPDGRGIFHWWNRNCYPQPCAPDDYCKKPMPNLCRPFVRAHLAEMHSSDEAVPVPIAPLTAPGIPATPVSPP